VSLGCLLVSCFLASVPNSIKFQSDDEAVVPGTTSTGITWVFSGILKRRNMESNRVWADVVGEEEVNYVRVSKRIYLPATPPALQHEAFIFI
jgi:hypothetical protein